MRWSASRRRTPARATCPVGTSPCRSLRRRAHHPRSRHRNGVRSQQPLRARAPHPARRGAASLAAARGKRRIGVPRRLYARGAGRLLQRHQPRPADRRHARAFSGLGVADFSSAITVQEATPRRPARARTGRDRARPAGGARGACACGECRGCPRSMRGLRHERRSPPRAAGHPASCSRTSMRPGTRRSSACTPTRCRGARRATTVTAGLNRYPEPQPRALLERAGAASTGCQQAGSSPAAAATRRSTCWCARSAVPGRTRSSSARRPSALRGRRAHPGRAVREVPLRAGDFGLDVGGSHRGGTRTPSWCSSARRTIPPATLLDEDAILDMLRRARRGSADRGRRGLHRVLRHGASLTSPARRASRTSSCCARSRRPMRWRRALRRADRHPRRSSVCCRASCRRMRCPPRRWRRCSRLTAEPQRRRRAARIATLRAERERVRARLAALPGVRTGPALGCQLPAGRVRGRRRRRSRPAARPGFCVRDLRAKPRLPGCLRITDRHAGAERAAARRAGALHERRARSSSSTATAP